MSPTSGCVKRSPIRLTSTRCPTCKVGTMDSLGIRYGLTRKAWMPRARPRATATINTSSTSDPEVEPDPFLAATPRYSLALLFVTVGRRLSGFRRLRLSDLGVRRRLDDLSLGERLLVDGLARDLGVDRGCVLRGRVVQDAALDDLLRTRVATLADAGTLTDATAQVVQLRATDVTAGGDLDLLDLRRMDRERALNADAEGLLADREGLAHPLALTLDHDALEDLRTTTRALDDLEVDLDAITRLEARDAAQLRALESVDNSAHGKKEASADMGRGRSIMVADARHAAETA